MASERIYLEKKIKKLFCKTLDVLGSIDELYVYKIPVIARMTFNLYTPDYI